MAKAGELYRPSNGTERIILDERWCSGCQRDAYWRSDPENICGSKSCGILSRTFIFDTDSEEYPREWTYDADGNPCCTAFEPIKPEEPTRAPRCKKTIDMFEDAKHD